MVGVICSSLIQIGLTVDIQSFWTEGYAGQIIPNSGHELAIYVQLWL